MKNKTSLFVLAVEILAIIVMHTLRVSTNDPTNISAKEVPPVKAELAKKEASEINHHFVLSSME